VGVEGGADLFDVGAVDADKLVEPCAVDAELVRPVGDVGGHFWVDLFGVVGGFDVRTLVAIEIGIDDVVVDGFGGGDDGVGRVGGDEGFSAVRFGHACFPLSLLPGWMSWRWVVMYACPPPPRTFWRKVLSG